MHICEWAVDLLLLKKWNFFCLSVLLVFVLYCDRNPPTLRTTSDLMMYVHTCYWKQYLHYGVCQISMSELMMNIHTFGTDNTTYTMLYVRSLCQIEWWMYTHVLLIIIDTPWCMSDHYVRFNDECAHIFTDNTPFTMLYVRSLYQI